MSKTLTFEVSDELFAALQQIAAKTGTTPGSLALQWLALYARAHRQELSDEERHAARERLMRYAGAVDSGDPRSADNERIEQDLTREYARPHDDQ